MSIIRNLTTGDIALNDLGGITIDALSDYNLDEETSNDIANSQDLNTAIVAGNIIFLDAQGNQLTQQESIDTQNSISTTFPAFTIQKAGSNVAGAPFPSINLGENVVASDGTTKANIDFISNVGISKTTIGGQEMMTFNDSARANKTLSVEKMPLLFVQSTVSSGTYLKIGKVVLDTNEGFIMPFNATIVGLSSHMRSPNGRTGTYALYIDNVSASGTLITYSGSSESRTFDNTLDYDISVGQTLQFRCTSISGGGMNKNQYDINVVLYVRWRG